MGKSVGKKQAEKVLSLLLIHESLLYAVTTVLQPLCSESGRETDIEGFGSSTLFGFRWNIGCVFICKQRAEHGVKSLGWKLPAWYRRRGCRFEKLQLSQIQVNHKVLRTYQNSSPAFLFFFTVSSGVFYSYV